MFNLLNNIWIKLVALAMGLLLWFHVATEKQYAYELTLPIKDIALKENLTLSAYPPESLTVEVSATGKQLMRKRWRDRGLKISATQFSTGRHELALTTANVSLAGDEASIQLQEIVLPTSITLNIDYETTADVSVLVDIEPKPADGFAVSSISPPEPRAVAVSGPRSLLGRINTVLTDRRELTGLRNSVTLNLPVIPPSGYGVDVDPDSVTVTVNVVPVKTRSIAAVPIVVFNGPRDKMPGTVPPTVKVEISGPPQDVDTLPAASVVASVNYNERNRNGIARVEVQVPTAFRVRNVTPKSVQVYVQ